MNTDNFYRSRPDIIWEDGNKHTGFKCELGKIERIEFGKVGDYPFLLGLTIIFSSGNGGCCTSFTMNMNEKCKWDYPSERQEHAMKIMQLVNDLLEDAKKENVSDLVNTPVEVYFDMNTCFVLGVLIGFRILTEVL